MATKDMGIPFGLGLASGIIILIVSIILGLIIAVLGAAATFFVGGIGAALGIGLMIWGIIVGILIIFGSLMMKDPKKARTGSILVLIFAILGFFTPGAGFYIAPILGIIGGALGIARTQ